MKYIAIIILLFSLTSCIELIDDLTINQDGSGKCKFTVNLSSSKVEVSSLLALDTINGYRVPKKSEIEDKLISFKKKLSEQPGISNITIETNWEDFIVKFSCDFQSIEQLQSGIKNAISEVDSKYKDINWLSYDGKSLKRNCPEGLVANFYNSSLLRPEKLKLGSYTSITRFESDIKKFDNIKSLISKSGKAIMIKTDAESFFNNPSLLNNKIYL